MIDLRNSPGGTLQAAVDCADFFLEEGVVVQVRGRNENNTYRAKAKQLLKGVPIAILTNETTASAAEIFAGALQDHERAIVVGARTFGKGSVQALFPLKSGSAIKLTTARFYLPSGANLQKPANLSDGDEWGIRPNKGYAVELTEDEARQYGPNRAASLVAGDAEVPKFVDRVLDKAVAYLKDNTKE